MYFMLIVLVNLVEMLLCTSLLRSAARFVDWEVEGDTLAFLQDRCMWREVTECRLRGEDRCMR
jgi:hypothetical protein